MMTRFIPSPTSFILPALVWLAACAPERTPTGAEPPEDSVEASGWQVIPTAPLSPASSRHDDLFFLNPGLAWLVNTRGEVFRTGDGGASWTRIHNQPNTFYRAVGFATETKGWVGNLNFFNAPTPLNALFETLDGGATWSNITARITGTTPVGICGIYVLDPQTVFAVGRWNGPAAFVRSLDGGATWEGVDLAPLATGLVDVHFFDRETGIIVGGLGVGNSSAAQDSSRTVILMTRDGGATWQQKYLSTRRGKWAWKISFPSRLVGYVSTQGPTPDGSVLKTVDGGETWTELAAAPGYGFSGIGFISELVGWVASDTTAYATTNGGANWQRVKLGTSVNRFRILSPTLGFAAGDGVYRYQPTSNP
jgi:photosystem II stability/assembly factor-like uncharacterized protein